MVIRHMHDCWWVAVIEPQTSNDKRAQEKTRVLALPKGMVDRGERPEQAAMREVREETGIDAELITKLTDIRYVYVRSWSDGQRVFKIVSFYLLRYRTGNIGEIAPEMRVEVSRADWIPLSEAHKRLSYRGERDVVRLAQEFVASNPNLAFPTVPRNLDAR